MRVRSRGVARLVAAPPTRGFGDPRGGVRYPAMPGSLRFRLPALFLLGIVTAGVLSSVIAQASDVPFSAPTLDYHALAPEIVLAVVVCAVLVADLFLDETRKWITASLAGFGLLGAFIPILTLAVDDGPARSIRSPSNCRPR